MGLHGYSPAHLVLFRYLTASALFLILAIAGKVRIPERRDLIKILLTGFLAITVYQLLLNIGEGTVSAGVASMLINSAPIWTAFMAHLWLNERLRPRQWAGILVGFSGIVLIALGQHGIRQTVWGTCLIVLAALAHSTGFILQKPLLERYRPLEFVAYEFWAGTLFLLPFAGGLLNTIRQADPQATWAVIYLGVGPGVIAYVTWAYVLSKMTASRAASLLYFIPGCTVLLSWVWLGEVPTEISVVGGAVAIAGVILVNRK